MRFPIGLQELLQASLGFLWSFLLYTDLTGSCTTTVNRWLCQDSQSSLRTLLICFGPLTNLTISLEISANTVFVEIHTSRRQMEKNWRVSLCIQELHHPPKMSLNSCSHFGQNNTGPPVLARDLIPFCFFQVSLTLVLDGNLSTQIFPCLSLFRLTQLWHELNDQSPVLKVSLMLKSENWRKNSFASQERFLSERSSPHCTLSESRFWWNVVTVDPFVGIPVFIAKISKRQHCWRVFEDFHCQEYIQLSDIHCSLFMRSHFSIGGYDCRRTSQCRQSIHFQHLSSPFCWSYASTLRIPQQILFPQVQGLIVQAGTCFPKVRSMLLCFSPLILEYFRPALLHGRKIWPGGSIS